MLDVRYILLREGASKPAYATPKSAAADLKACFTGLDEVSGLKVENGEVVIPAGARAAIPTGVAIEPVFGVTVEERRPERIPPEDGMPRDGQRPPFGGRHGFGGATPDNCVGLVFARSGLATKAGIALANGVGVIDSDYRGELIVSIVNNGDKPFTVRSGDRIAQLAFMPIYTANFVEFQTLGATDRGGGGFGSTGV